MPLLTPSAVSFMTQSIPRQKRKGDSIHPCFTPVLISKSSVRYWAANDVGPEIAI